MAGRPLIVYTDPITRKSEPAERRLHPMTTVDEAKSIYESELRELLEGEFCGQYVAIVTNPRCHFVRPTFLGAAMAAKEAEPQQVPFVIRIGHDAAFHIGAVSR